jgi:hypothetical protein
MLSAPFDLDTYVRKRILDKLADAVGFTGADNVVIGLIMLEHLPH